MTTLQSLYEKMRQHLLAMPGPAWDILAGACQYRTSDGNACLVGCLLTDGEAEEADSKTLDADDLARRYFARIPHARAFLQEAQLIHDKDAGANAAVSHAGNVEAWRAAALLAFDALAVEHDLKVPA